MSHTHLTVHHCFIHIRYNSVIIIEREDVQESNFSHYYIALIHCHYTSLLIDWSL